jgi:hypothetical protein
MGTEGMMEEGRFSPWTPWRASRLPAEPSWRSISLASLSGRRRRTQKKARKAMRIRTTAPPTAMPTMGPVPSFERELPEASLWEAGDFAEGTGV